MTETIQQSGDNGVQTGVEAARRLLAQSLETGEHTASGRPYTKKELAMLDHTKDLAWVETYEAELLRQAELEASRSIKKGLTPKQRDLAVTRSHDSQILEQALSEAATLTPRLEVGSK